MGRIQPRDFGFCAALLLCAALSRPVHATAARIDAETCTQLRLEQIKFKQSGVLDDMKNGPEWAKSNLSPERLREVELYIQLDEQVKFGCRDAKLSPDLLKAQEAATRQELNLDPDQAMAPSDKSSVGTTDPDNGPVPPSKPKKKKQSGGETSDESGPAVDALPSAKNPKDNGTTPGKDLPWAQPPPVEAKPPVGASDSGHTTWQVETHPTTGFSFGESMPSADSPRLPP